METHEIKNNKAINELYSDIVGNYSMINYYLKEESDKLYSEIVKLYYDKTLNEEQREIIKNVHAFLQSLKGDFHYNQNTGIAKCFEKIEDRTKLINLLK